MRIEPQATGNSGAWSLPDGGAYYANRLKNSTTTDLTADQIHQIGLDQVARIHGEMERIKDQVGFKGTLQQFFAPHHRQPAVQISEHRRRPAAISGRRPRLHRPGDGNGAAMVPPLAQGAAGGPRRREMARRRRRPVAFYNRPVAGRFAARHLLREPRRHEPGAEAPDRGASAITRARPATISRSRSRRSFRTCPKFRRFGGYGAYAEGWGLYAERLGKEMGFYKDPYSRVRHALARLWRAIRLVVDTGIHSKQLDPRAGDPIFPGQRACCRSATRPRRSSATSTIPGQATSYMIGQLKILELRDKAQAGARAEVRHPRVPRAWCWRTARVPLDVLEELVDSYIAEKKG